MSVFGFLQVAPILFCSFSLSLSLFLSLFAMSGDGFCLFSTQALKVVNAPTREQEEARAEAAVENSRQFLTRTAWSRILPLRRQYKQFAAKDIAAFSGVLGYEIWKDSKLLAPLPCHGKVRTAGVDRIIVEKTVEAIDPAQAKKSKAHDKNVRRRHAKAAAKKAAREAAEAAAAAAAAASGGSGGPSSS